MNRPYSLVRATIAMLVLDLVWVGTVMRPRYEGMVRRVQGEGRGMVVRLAPAAVAYGLMAVGLHAFVLPAGEGEGRTRVALRGALFGAVLYGVYNATAMAVLERWEARTALLDVGWGAALYAVCGAIGAHMH